MNNKKLLIIIVFFVLFIFFILFLIDKKNNDNKNQSCTTTIYSKFKIPDNNVSYKVDMKIVKSSDVNGYIKLLGAITVNETYSINRVVYFKMLANEEKHNLSLSITSERKAINDNVSDEMFNRYFRAFNLHALGYVEINEIDPELYLFSSSFGPYFVCMLQHESFSL